MNNIMELCDGVRETAFAHGLLMNFGAPKFEIRKYALSMINENRMISRESAKDAKIMVKRINNEL